MARFFPNAEEMALIDKYTIEEVGIHELVLMEKAAMSVFEEIKNYADKLTENNRNKKSVRVLIVCENGNNGADGVCTARLIKQSGLSIDTDVVIIDEVKKRTDSMTRQINIAEKLGVSFLDKSVFENNDFVNSYDIVVDAIFGIGLKREVQGIWAEIINKMNEASAYKIAIDTPSGVSMNDGRILGTGFKADLTVTFGYEKLGMLYAPGIYNCGRIVVKDIGFAREAISVVGPKHYSFDEELLKACMPKKRRIETNKGDFGKVVVIGGSRNMCGAVKFAADAALKMGAGLVKIFTEESNRVILQTNLPEAMLTTYDEKRLIYEDDEIEKLDIAVSWADVIILGPGLGQTREAKKLVERMFMILNAGDEAGASSNRAGKSYNKKDKRIVIDADGLNIISSDEKLLAEMRKCKSSIVITPHIREMSRLILGDKETEYYDEYAGAEDIISYIKEHADNVAKRFADRYSENAELTVVLKDYRTIIPGNSENGEIIYVNTTGNPGMAKGGSGDILSGVVGGLMAIGLSAFDAARMGTYIHGLAGDLATMNYGENSVLATDIINQLVNAINRIQ